MVKRIAPILQARMGSTRLPGKVLMKICGESILSHIVKRVELCDISPSHIWLPPVVATTTNPADDAIEFECARIGVKCCRGSEDDVLSRFYEVAVDSGAQNIMRICCDNPLLDPRFLSALAEFYCENHFSYVTNAQVPIGLATEIFTFERLKDAYLYGQKKHHREHVTPFIYDNDDGCGYLVHEPDLSHLRFTVDTPEDFSFITEVYRNLFKHNPMFGLDEVLALLQKRPELLEINKGIKQKKLA